MHDGPGTLVVGARTFDLTSRAVVVAVLGAGEVLVDHGADMVELTDPRSPVYPLDRTAWVTATSDEVIGEALAAGAGLVRLPAPTANALKLCAAGGASVVVPAVFTSLASAAGLSPDRIVADSLVIDALVAAGDASGDAGADGEPMVVVAVGVVRGGRIVRVGAADVVAARRVCDVLAAVMDAC